MVGPADAARKRIRDYSAERARRNELARERGFTSLDAQQKARRAGLFPSAAAIRTSPSAAQRARDVTAQRRAGARDAAQLESWDKKSREWSRRHSRQKGTEFDTRWPQERRASFYKAFVMGWKLPHDERNWDDLYGYMRDYPDDWAVDRLDGNPYNN